MFLGTIEPEIRSMVVEHARSVGSDEWWIGCSGNYTIERFLSTEFPGARLHSNDVSIYTSTLGEYLAGNPVALFLKEEKKAELGWLEPYLETDAGKIATMLLGTRFLGMVGKEGAYYERMMRGFRKQFPKMHADTLAKVEANELRLASYSSMDVRDWLRDVVPADAPVVSFPPFFCLTPDQRILTADFTWVPCGDLIEGQKIVAFDEEPQPGSRCRRWKYATVTRSEPAVRECVRVKLSNGESFICTTDHPWLATKSGQTWWVPADELMAAKPNGKKRRMFPVKVFKTLETWTRADTFDAGWLSGILDGEGTIMMPDGSGHGSAKLAIAQVAGPVADKAVEILRRHGFDVTVNIRPIEQAHHKPVCGIEIAGGVGEIMRALGTFQPMRLLARLENDLDITMLTTRMNSKDVRVEVVAVKPVGLQTVQSISTSSRTYVGEGYLHHNSGGYEAMWKPLEDTFDWPEPSYEMLDDDAIADVLHRIMHRRHWMFASNHRWEDLEPNLCGIVQTSHRRVPNYVYSSTKRPRIVRPTDTLKPVLAPRMGAGDVIGDRIALAPLEIGEFNTLRAQYLNPGIRTSAPAMSCAVLSEGRVLGAFAFLPPKFDHGTAYLMSDFPVDGSDYPKLSKLIVLAATSREAQHLLQNMLSRRMSGVATTAFTQRPVSMKYRAILDLVSRKKSNEPGFAYQLHYEGRLGEHTLAEALSTWKKRWGGTREETSDQGTAAS